MGYIPRYSDGYIGRCIVRLGAYDICRCSWRYRATDIPLDRSAGKLRAIRFTSRLATSSAASLLHRLFWGPSGTQRAPPSYMYEGFYSYWLSARKQGRKAHLASAPRSVAQALALRAGVWQGPICSKIYMERSPALDLSSTLQPQLTHSSLICCVSFRRLRKPVLRVTGLW